MYSLEITPFDKADYFLRKLAVAKCRTRTAPQQVKIDQYDLNYIYEKQDGKCAITGRTMTFIKPGSKKKRVATNCSIDRIDSSKGYVPGNVHLVCVAENISKNRYSLKHYLQLRKNNKKYYDRFYA